MEKEVMFLIRRQMIALTPQEKIDYVGVLMEFLDRQRKLTIDRMTPDNGPVEIVEIKKNKKDKSKSKNGV
jgi:hypothetical protein